MGRWSFSSSLPCRWHATSLAQSSPWDIATRFLTALHPHVYFPLIKNVGLFSPLVLRDIAQGGGPWTRLYRQQFGHAVAAANLCSSLSNKRIGGVLFDDAFFAQVVRQLLATQGEVVNRGAAATPSPADEPAGLSRRGKPAGSSETDGVSEQNALVPCSGRPVLGKPLVSLCMIVRNEAGHLERCLASVAGLVDEMIVVDTGSTDRTREIAVQAGARVFEFAWQDSFAAARNESLRHATGDWIFWLDADEYLDQANQVEFQALRQGLKDNKSAYVMRQMSQSADGTGSAMAVDQVRLFSNDPALRWEYRVHEQILLSIRRAGHQVCWTDIVIGHTGYQQSVLAGEKLERNIRLLRLQDGEKPNDPVTLYHLGLAVNQQGRSAEALPLLQRSLELTPAHYSTRAKLYAMLSRIQYRLGQREQALAVCRAGRREHPVDAELLFVESMLLLETRDLGGAEACLLKLLGLPARQQFTSVDAGLVSYKARYLLGEVYEAQGRLEEARQQWRQVCQEQPGYPPAQPEAEIGLLAGLLYQKASRRIGRASSRRMVSRARAGSVRGKKCPAGRSTSSNGPVVRSCQGTSRSGGASASRSPPTTASGQSRLGPG